MTAMDATDAVWISVLPSMKDFSGKLAEGLGKSKAPDTEGAKFGKRMGLALLGGLTTVVGGATVAGKALYAIGETFDDVTDTIRVGTGATGKALDDLVASAKNVGTKVPASFEDIGSTVADVNTRMGLSGETLEKVASQYLEAGRILGEEVDIMKTGAAFNAFKIEGEDVSGALDHLFRVSQATGIGMNDLAGILQQNAPAIQSLGFSFEEAAGMVGTLDKAGLNSSKMMGGLSKALVTLAKDGEEPADAFNRTVGEIDALMKAGDKAGAIDLAGQIFGSKNAAQFVGAIESGNLALDDLANAMGMTDDTILGAGEDTMDFAEQWDLFKNQIMVEVAPAAEWLFGIISDGMKWVSAVAVPAIKAFIEQWKNQEGTAGKVRAVFEKVWGVLKAVFTFIWDNKELFGTLAAGIGLVVGAMKLLNLVMRANPLGLVLTAVMLLVTGIMKLYQENETFRKIVDAVWSAIKKAIGGVADWITNTVWPGLKRAWEAIANGFSWMKDEISVAWDTIKNTAKTAFDWLTWLFFNFTGPGLIIKHWDTIKGAFSSAWNWIRDTFGGWWNGLTNLITNPIDTAKRSIDTILDGVQTAFRNTRDGVKKIWNGIKNIMAGPIEWVKINVINPFLTAVKTFLTGIGATTLAGKIKLISTTAGAAAGAGARAAGFAGGGWTGPGAKYQPAGIVHADEFVVNKAARGMFEKRFPGYLQHINMHGTLPGYAGGGQVAPVPGRGNRHRSGYPWATWAGDYPQPMGTPVRAWKNGLIALVRHLTTSYGKHVRINHDDGTSSLYAHLSRILVGTGQRVIAGQAIGNVGSTGNSTGPHLHFETMGGPFNGGSAASAGLRGLVPSMSGSATAYTGVERLLDRVVKPILDKVGNIGGGWFGEAMGRMPHLMYDGVKQQVKDFLGFQSGGTVPYDGLHWLSEDGRPELVAGKQLGAMRAGTTVHNADSTEQMLANAVVAALTSNRVRMRVDLDNGDLWFEGQMGRHDRGSAQALRAYGLGV